MRARSTHTGDAAAACDKPSVPPAAASTPAGRAKLKQLHLDVGQVCCSRHSAFCFLYAHSQVILPSATLGTPHVRSAAWCLPAATPGTSGPTPPSMPPPWTRRHSGCVRVADASAVNPGTWLTRRGPQGWQQERVVWRAAGCATTRVVHVAPGDASSHWSSARQLGSIVSTALGLPDDWLLPPCAPAAGAKAIMSPSSPHTADGAPIHVLLYVTSTHRVGGVVVGHPLRAAHRVCPPSATAGAGGGILCCAEHAEAAACGVRAIWVHPSHRRKGVATALLDGLRGAVVGGGTGVLVPRELLAFSQPTPQGRALAERYTRTTQFLVYT